MKSTSTKPGNEKIGILLVLKNRGTVNLLTRVLQPHPMSALGMNIFGAASIDEARNTLELFVPDILVIDLDMMDSWLLLQEAQRDFQQVDVIAVTSSDQRAQLARQQGIENVLTSSGEEDLVGSLLYMLGVEDSATPRGPGVLLVGENNEEYALLFALLMHSGYDVRMSATTTAAREAVERDSEINLILLDILVPGGGALELIRETAGRFPRIGAIILTSVCESEVVQLALNLGAFECLVKPLDADRVISAIEACLAHIEYRSHRPWWRRIWEHTA